jgi:hypothetical protein
MVDVHDDATVSGSASGAPAAAKAVAKVFEACEET